MNFQRKLRHTPILRQTMQDFVQSKKSVVRIYNKPLEYAQLVLGGEIGHDLSLGCDHGRLEDP